MSSTLSKSTTPSKPSDYSTSFEQNLIFSTNNRDEVRLNWRKYSTYFWNVSKVSNIYKMSGDFFSDVCGPGDCPVEGADFQRTSGWGSGCSSYRGGKHVCKLWWKCKRDLYYLLCFIVLSYGSRLATQRVPYFMLPMHSVSFYARFWFRTDLNCTIWNLDLEAKVPISFLTDNNP